MNIEIRNLDNLPEEERERFEAFLRQAIAEGAQDQELRSYLINFVSVGDDDIRQIDASELWEAAVLQERYQEYTFSPEQFDPEQLDDDLLNSFSSGADQTPEDDEMTVPRFQAPDTSESEGPEFEPPESEAVNDIPAPSIDVPPGLEGRHDPDAERSARPDDSAAVGPESNAGFDLPEENSENEAETSRAKDSETPTEREKRLEEENRRMRELMQQGGPYVAAPAGESVGVAGGSPLTGVGSALGNGAKSLVSGTGKLLGGTMALTGATLSMTGNAAKLSAPHIKNAVESSMRVLKRKRPELLTVDTRAALRGEEQADNVIDLQGRLDNQIARHTKPSVERELSLLRDSQLSGQRQVVMDIVRDVNEGRFSTFEVSTGITAAAAVKSAMSENETEANMAKALIANAGNLPDAQTEMAFVAREYQEMADHLDSLGELAQEKGWSQEDIAEQFGKPMEEWLDSRKEEDELLAGLSKLQPSKDEEDSELSAEQKERMREALEKAAEALRRAILRMMGQNPDQSHDQGSGQSKGPSINMS